MDFDKIPNYPKPKEQVDEIIFLLKKSFLTQKLADDEISKIAGAMQPRNFKANDLIIKYGDVGKEYFVLAKGDVKVTVYNKDVKTDDPDLENKI